MPGQAKVKHCPSCRNRNLDVTHYDGEEIDICRDCGGLWFEQDNLNAVFASQNQNAEAFDYNPEASDALAVSDRHCPDCTAPLHRHQVLADYSLHVAHCHDCDGTWVRKEDVTAITRTPDLAAALGRINKDRDWGVWSLQFLSGMPVEYNMRPHRMPWVTYGLLALNALAFLLMLGHPADPEQLFRVYGMTPSAALQGERLWTWLTHLFVHGGVMHLAFNLYFLWVVGDNIEDATGPWRFIGLYLLLGLLAAAGSIAGRPESGVPSVGASGAIAGLFAMYILWFPKATITFMLFVFQRKIPVAVFFGGWAVLQIVLMGVGGQGVDYLAHIAGFVAGLAIGALLRGWVFHANPLMRLLASPRAQTEHLFSGTT